VNPSTVSRLLATLADAGLVRRAPDSGRFRLGPRLVELGIAALARVDLRQLGRPHLLALTEATGETSTLSIPNGESTITVDFVQSPSSVRSVAEVGRPSVAHATATGKVFLAHGGRTPTGRLPSFTSRTITDPRLLAAEIVRTRDRGWAQAMGEREADLNALAAPVIIAGGTLVGVLGLQGPASRFDPPAMRTAVGTLVAHAAQLSAIEGLPVR
jgi:IclR family acetate operon transcriptional repressor